MKRFSGFLSVLLGCLSVTLGAAVACRRLRGVHQQLVPGHRCAAERAVHHRHLGQHEQRWSTCSIPAKTYTGACPAGRIYWQTADTKVPPDCSSNQWISVDNNRCEHAVRSALRRMAGGAAATEMLLKQNASNVALNPTKWGNLSPAATGRSSARPTSDNHGDDPGTSPAAASNKYPRNGTGTADANRWGNNGSSQQIATGATSSSYSLYSSNYINWWNSTEDGVPKTRLEIVQEVAADMVDTLQGVNLGLMRYSATEGGMVTYPVSELTDAARAEMTDSSTSYEADGFTPLSETLFEAYHTCLASACSTATPPRPTTVTSLSVAAFTRQAASRRPRLRQPDGLLLPEQLHRLPDRRSADRGQRRGRPRSNGRSPPTRQRPAPRRSTNPDPALADFDGRCLENLARYMHEPRPALRRDGRRRTS